MNDMGKLWMKIEDGNDLLISSLKLISMLAYKSCTKARQFTTAAYSELIYFTISPLSTSTLMKLSLSLVSCIAANNNIEMQCPESGNNYKVKESCDFNNFPTRNQMPIFLNPPSPFHKDLWHPWLVIKLVLHRRRRRASTFNQIQSFFCCRYGNALPKTTNKTLFSSKCTQNVQKNPTWSYQKGNAIYTYKMSM